MLCLSTTTAYANTNCAYQSITIIAGIAGDTDIYCDAICDSEGWENVPDVQVDVQKFGKNFCRTLVQSDTDDGYRCYAVSWIYTSRDDVKWVYNENDIMADAKCASSYTMFNTFYGAKGNGRCSHCTNTYGMKNHVGYWGDQSEFTEWETKNGSRDV